MIHINCDIDGLTIEEQDMLRDNLASLVEIALSLNGKSFRVGTTVS